MENMFDVSEIRDNHLFGIPLKDADGNDFSDELLQTYLNSAIAWAEKKLQIVIVPRTVEEKHDFILQDYQNWGFMRLWKKPVIEVESLSLYYGHREMYNIPDDWLQVDNISGQLMLFPMSGSAGGMIVTAQGGMVTPLLTGAISYAPKMWHVKYKAGVEDPTDGDPMKEDHIHTPTTLHPDLKDLVYKRASAEILTVWGDLIIGAGIANQSLSLDGLSQSVGTTQSAMYGGASGRINQIEKDIQLLVPQLQKYYTGISMTVL